MAQPLLPDTLPPDTHRRESEDRLARFAQLRHMGIQRVEVCRIMGISGATHDTWLAQPYVQQYLEELAIKQETHTLLLKDRLKCEANNILTRLFGMAADESTPAQVRVNIMQDLLDREGSVPRKQHVEHSGEQKIFSDEQFQSLLEGMAESARRR